MRAPSEEKSDDSKDSFFLRITASFFVIFSKYHRKILLRYFNAKLGTENFFKPTIGNESLHQYSNNNGDGIVDFAT
jgi:hypothetical protein